MKKNKFLVLCLSFIMIFSLTGCGGSSSSASDSYVSESYNFSDSTATSVSGGGALGKVYSSINSVVTQENGAAPQSAMAEEETIELKEVPDAEPEEVEEEFVEKKIVYSANLDMETKDIELALEQIKTSLDEFNGYIESEHRNNWNSFEEVHTRRSADISLRIPSKHFETFLSGLNNENLIITSMNKDSIDFSEYYYDKQSRIDSLRIQETRLLELLSQADSVSVMLEIENSLTDVRYEIESLTKELKTIDSNVEYSTITIWVREVLRYTTPVNEPESFWDELKEVCVDSAEEFVWFLRDFLFGFIYFFPYLVIIIVVIVVYRKATKKKRLERKARRALKKSIKKNEE